MTIKQAFEALSDACANGMKNPFFVMRRHKESFADVASKVDAGGSVVEVEAIQTTGTKIATISVDNTETDIYAPEGGGGYDYSTDEVNTGRKWTDGRDIYSKCFNNVTVKQTQDAQLSVSYSNVLAVNCFGPAIASGFQSIPVVRATMTDTIGVKTDVYPLSITADTFTGCTIEVLYCKISS